MSNNSRNNNQMSQNLATRVSTLPGVLDSIICIFSFLSQISMSRWVYLSCLLIAFPFLASTHWQRLRCQSF
ncbi:hypothetical protein WG66_003275 [Moniliophthora roreri]|nr:hypothetical protein WG66_010636 [Moniliophthora roreri]KAI3614851.1 hypothetical protein WG66_003275 [Moniliophthora roreri]